MLFVYSGCRWREGPKRSPTATSPLSLDGWWSTRITTVLVGNKSLSASLHVERGPCSTIIQEYCTTEDNKALIKIDAQFAVRFGQTFHRTPEASNTSVTVT